MQSVLNVLVNRAGQRSSSIYEEAVRHLQFSSMTALGDPNLILWPQVPGDAQFAVALDMASQAAQGSLPDITGGATFYYATSMRTPPAWSANMTHTAEIAGQVFFKEQA